jgi:hypothetical protein
MSALYKFLTHSPYAGFGWLWLVYAIPMYIMSAKVRRNWVASIKGSYNWPWAVFWLIVSPSWPAVLILYLLNLAFKSFKVRFINYRESTSFKEPPKWM